ncbi:peptidylprolyl isomerase [Cognatishimia sp. MH4019]|uniref:peptidylprolyl isomerase n=1 Tax=Cognatishimia sp. MH4019 TaxID=2854030 RepID=UPI001CD7273D|nr:peptidylprolyl isomerase [Cognatishimia sp. MH4019]
MSKHHNFLLAVATTICGAFPAFAQEMTADTVVANVNGTEITVGHMITARAQLPQQYQQLPDDVLFEGIREQLVQQTVLSQQTADVPKSVELSLENERRAAMAGVAINEFIADAVTDEMLQSLYEEKYASVEPEKEFNASHILVETEEEALALVTELEGGADFAELAKEKSTGPSGPGGGSLGWFGPGMMVKPFEDAVIGLEDGAISAPVQTQFGWHVIKLDESRLKDAPTLDDVREELTAELQQVALETHITELTEAAEVTLPDLGEIDASILRNADLLSE